MPCGMCHNTACNGDMIPRWSEIIPENYSPEIISPEIIIANKIC